MYAPLVLFQLCLNRFKLIKVCYVPNLKRQF